MGYPMLRDFTNTKTNVDDTSAAFSLIKMCISPHTNYKYPFKSGGSSTSSVSSFIPDVDSSVSFFSKINESCLQ